MVNWNIFENLPGSQDYNFELLSRSLIWLAYSRFGNFRALLNQPGVEFDLKLDYDCKLGEKGRHFGWQCRWYSIDSGVNIGKTRRDKIKDALNKSIVTIPGLTDWVLWTRHTLTKADQQWFATLSSNIRLHLWTNVELETLLDTDGEQLKQAYFGELVLSPEQLSAIHKNSVEPIKKRWFPEVHQELDAERSVLRMLGRPLAWNQINELVSRIEEAFGQMQYRIQTVPESLKDLCDEFMDCMEAYVLHLKSSFELLGTGNFLNLRQGLNSKIDTKLGNVSALPRKLRGARLQIGLIATNVLADLNEADQLLSEIREFLNTRLIGIVADAGGGKTQLSAKLTATLEDRPAGMLVLGRFLKHNMTLDDLARTVIINGKPIQSMEALICALDAAAERSRCILPLVIDGLNEAEDPREWKYHLSSLTTILGRYPNVLVVCTLRSGSNRRKNREEDYIYSKDRAKPHPFVEQCLPEGTVTFEIPDFGDDIGNAMNKYFSYFKIEVPQNLSYVRFLRHPLTLRIFCEVSNPSREKTVGMEAVPRSLASLFEKYIELAAERIEELSPYHCRYHQADITGYLDKIAETLWIGQARAINQQQFRDQIRDTSNWNHSVVNFMEQEGLLLRMPGKLASQDEIVPTYDLLGGYLIARYIIFRNGRDTIKDWMKSKLAKNAFEYNSSSSHPLRDDILQFLVALLPQYHHTQLWEVVGPTLKGEALQLSILLDPKYLGTPTIEAIAEGIRKSETHTNRYLGRLLDVCETEKHPLNSLFVSRVLSSMKPGKRDLVWSEWLRRNHKSFEENLDRYISKWSQATLRNSSDHLMARWIMWMLTSTNNRMRQKATLALYFYARSADSQLFDLATESLSFNDPYVPERMLAACYGAAMARATDVSDSLFRNDILPTFARSLFELMFGKALTHRYTHLLIIEFTRGIIELAASLNSSLFLPEELSEVYRTTIASKEKRVGKKAINPKTGESPFRMDFENYVIGRLVPGRSNYDYKNKDYEKMRSSILSRIYKLGWNFKEFENVDRSIENSSRNSYNRHEDNEINKVDRYGKKYSWIAYYEQMGLMPPPDPEQDNIYVEGREDYMDIDPSFPLPQNGDRLIDLDTLGDAAMPLQKWLRSGEIPDLGIYLQQDAVNGDDQSGPWVLLDGHIAQQDEHRGRSMFGFFRTFFVAKDQCDELVSLLEAQRLGGRWLPEIYEERSSFAGEIPWSKHFGERRTYPLSFEVDEKTVEVQEEQEVLYLDGEAVELSWNDKLRRSGIDFSGLLGDDPFSLSEEDLNRLEVKKELVTVKRTETQRRSIPVIQPTCDLRTPGKTILNEFTGGSTLSKQLSLILGLHVIPQSRDLRDVKGQRATFQNSYKKDSFKNSERLFYVRKDLLDELLEKLGMSLVWAIWGERELSLGQFELWDRMNPGKDIASADFKQIFVYPYTMVGEVPAEK